MDARAVDARLLICDGNISDTTTQGTDPKPRKKNLFILITLTYFYLNYF